MLSNETLAILCCPKDHSRLRLAEPKLVAQLNAAISAGQLRNRANKPIEHQIDGGLIRAAGDLLYPIVDRIPVMLYDEAIALDQLRGI
jgi:uncharacterized protein YbaR (Trm112 family)